MISNIWGEREILVPPLPPLYETLISVPMLLAWICPITLEIEMKHILSINKLCIFLLPAPPGEVNHSLVTRELLTLQSVRLIWLQPEDNNGHITSYNLTYCAMDNRFCMQQTSEQTFSTKEMVILLQLIPLRTYQVYIRAVNDVGQGPEPAEPYFFESATQGICLNYTMYASFHFQVFNYPADSSSL